MKTTFLLLIGWGLITTSIFAQDIPNGDFEAWTDGNPDNWDCSNEDLSLFEIKNISGTTDDPYEGEISLLAESMGTAFFTMSGIICNGEYEAPNPVNGNVETIKGVPFTSQPDMFKLGYKCEPMDNDSALIKVAFFKEGMEILKEELIIYDNVDTWTDLSFTFDWTEIPEPDTMLIFIKSSYGTTNELGSTVAGSKIWVDDIRFEESSNITNYELAKIKVYPNPFQDYISYRTETNEKAEVNVYSISGMLLIQEIVFGNKQINTTTLKPGTYFVEVKINGERKIEKMIKTLH
jgi:hypothetical protein